MNKMSHFYAEQKTIDRDVARFCRYYLLYILQQTNKKEEEEEEDSTRRLM